MTLFTSQSAAMFYDKLFSSLDFTLPRAATGRRGFPKKAMVCAFIVMKRKGFAQITDLMDYLDNNRIIAHYCGFNIMEPLPSYWTYDRCLRQLNNGALKSIMANLVRKLYELGVVDASFVGLDSTPVMANTKQNNPKSFAKSKFSKENHPKSDPDCALGVHSASNQHNERRYEFYWGYKSHVLVDCISGLPLYELTTQANIMDSTVAVDILAAANQILPLQGPKRCFNANTATLSCKQRCKQRCSYSPDFTRFAAFFPFVMVLIAVWASAFVMWIYRCVVASLEWRITS